MRITIVLFLLLVAGCATSIIYNSKGEELYYDKCGGCHRLYTKTKLSKEKWRREVEDMSKKAKLSDEEKRMIIEYLANENLHIAKP